MLQGSICFNMNKRMCDRFWKHSPSYQKRRNSPSESKMLYEKLSGEEMWLTLEVYERIYECEYIEYTVVWEPQIQQRKDSVVETS